jgi:NitT/TauT family transport system ATP-binding protein
MLLRLNEVGLTFSQDGTTPFTALKNISFHVNTGEFVSIVGPSGCGKTSLLRLVSGTIQPSAGQIERAPELREKRRIGIVFQEPVLLPWRSAESNVQLPLEIIRCSEGEIPGRVAGALETVSLSSFAKYLPRQLSGGMQQRVAIARALVTDPPILLMDEPFSALDTFSREAFITELESIWARTAKTVMFVTHSISEAVMLSDRVLVMTPNPGTILDAVCVELPRPRTDAVRDSIAFADYCGIIRRLLKPKST